MDNNNEILNNTQDALNYSEVVTETVTETENAGSFTEIVSESTEEKVSDTVEEASETVEEKAFDTVEASGTLEAASGTVEAVSETVEVASDTIEAAGSEIAEKVNASTVDNVYTQTNENDITESNTFASTENVENSNNAENVAGANNEDVNPSFVYDPETNSYRFVAKAESGSVANENTATTVSSNPEPVSPEAAKVENNANFGTKTTESVTPFYSNNTTQTSNGYNSYDNTQTNNAYPSYNSYSNNSYNQGYSNNSYGQGYNNYNSYGNYDDSIPLKKSGLAIAGLVISIIAIFFDPCYVPSVLGLIFGIVGVNQSTDKTYRAIGTAAWIVACVSLFIQVFGDTFITICSFGLGFFTFFI